MRRLRILRLIAVVGPLLWLGAVYWYWRGHVPLVAESTLKFDSPQRGSYFGHTAEGEPFYLHQGNPSPYGGFATAGPIDVRSPDGKSILRSFLGREHRLRPIWWERPDILQVFSEDDDLAQLFDVSMGRTLFNGRKFDGGRARRSPDGTFIALLHQGRLDIYRAEDEQLLWTESDVESFFFLGSELVKLVFARPEGVSANQELRREWRDAVTGEPDPQAPGLDFDWGHVSANGRLVIGKLLDQRHFVMDLRSRQTLWSLPDLKNPLLNGLVPFLPDSSQVILPYRLNGRIRVSSWTAQSGELLTDPPPVNIEPVTSYQISGDGQLLISDEKEDGLRVPTLMLAILNSVGINWDGVLIGERSYLAVTDVSTNGWVGAIETPGVIRPTGAGFSVTSRSGIEFYSSPPRKNWGWLAGWGLLPFFFMGIGATAWKLRRYSCGSHRVSDCDTTPRL